MHPSKHPSSSRCILLSCTAQRRLVHHILFHISFSTCLLKLMESKQLRKYEDWYHRLTFLFGYAFIRMTRNTERRVENLNIIYFSVKCEPALLAITLELETSRLHLSTQMCSGINTWDRFFMFLFFCIFIMTPSLLCWPPFDQKVSLSRMM